MGRKSNVYSKIDDADAIIKKLCDKQSAVLWAVKPETVTVMGIENKERSKKNHTLAKIKPVKGTEKAIYGLNHIPYRYIVEVYWSDFNMWSKAERAAILFHELLHIHPEGERVIKHDCEDWRVMLDALGVDWVKKGEALPDLTRDDVKFNLELRPKIDDLEDEDEDGEDNLDDIEKKKEIKEAKAKAKEAEKAQRKAKNDEISDDDAVVEEKADGKTDEVADEDDPLVEK